MKKTILLACALVAGAACAEFKAGFARIEATPPLGIPLVGYFSHRVSDGVLDPLYIGSTSTAWPSRTARTVRSSTASTTCT